MLITLLRVVVSALMVGMVATGTSLQLLLQNGNLPTKGQIQAALLSGLVLALNDVKSRLTPPA
jgi:biotin transporter BioY